MWFIASAWADGAAAASHPSMWDQLMLPAAIVGIFFFLVIRPQQKRAQTLKDFNTALKRGDSVLTTGGILGTIEGLTEQFVILQISDNVKVRVLRSAIAGGLESETVKK